MGDQTITFDFKQDGTRLSGALSALGNHVTFDDGKVDGDSFSFVVRLKGMKAKARGTFSDGKLVGKIKVSIATLDFVAERE